MKIVAKLLESKRGAAYLVLAFSLALSLGAAYYLATAAAARDELRFENLVQRTQDSILNRMEMYVAILRATAGRMESRSYINRELFGVFVKRLEVQRNYPGIQGVGYSACLRPGQKDAFVARLRREGTVDFTIHPLSSEKELHPVIYLEPRDRRNQAAIGYDMFTNPTRRAAIERSRDTGMPAATGKVTLVQEIDKNKQAGFLVYVPVYRRGAPVATTEQRRAALEGFAYSPFRADDLMRGILGKESNPEIGFSIYTGVAPADNALLSRVEPENARPSYKPRLATERQLRVVDSPWTIRFHTLPEFDVGSGRNYLPIFLIVGLLISGILFRLTLAQSNARALAERLRLESLRTLGFTNKLLAAQAEASLDGVLVVDPNGKMVSLNQRFARLWSIPNDILESRSDEEAISHVLSQLADPDRFLARVKSLYERPDEISQEELALRDGRTFERYSAPIRGSDGERFGRVWFFRDITERKQNERLKTEFLANVSHELKTPLTLTLAPVESLLAGDAGPVPGPQRELLESVHNNALRLLQMVMGLLDFSKLDAGKVELKREPTDMAALTRTLLNDFAPLAKKRGVALNQDLGQEIVVDIDRYLYERIVFNLVSNALKFTAPGGSVRVAISWRGDRLRLSVADNGVGIPETELPHLFQRFRQVEGLSTRRFEGTGLGLALVKEFAQLLGGSVSVESSAGKGSTFIVDCLAPQSQSVPRMEAAQDATRRLSLVQRHAGAQNTGASPATIDGLPRVLVAEDNPELAAYICGLLKEFCAVHVAEDGEQALQMAIKEPPDLVLSDVMMPRRDGLSLCRELKARRKTAKVPVVLLTALTQREALMKGWEAGADEYLYKPFHPKELVTRIKSLLSNSQLRADIERITVQSQKMSAVGQLAAGVAHEINNPLGVILGFAEGVARRIKEGDPFYVPLKSIEREAVRCRSLVQNLLMFSRQGGARIESFDVNGAVEAVVALVKTQSKVKTVEVIHEPGDCGNLKGDKNQIQQTLINLCNNAIDAMPHGGQLRLRTAGRKKEGRQWVVLEVQDNGGGIPEAIRDKIFDPFFTTKEPGKGTGLGLALAHECVQKHGGTIEIQSQVGAGTTFTIELPAVEAEVSSPKKGAPAAT